MNFVENKLHLWNRRDLPREAGPPLGPEVTRFGPDHGTAYPVVKILIIGDSRVGRMTNNSILGPFPHRDGTLIVHLSTRFKNGARMHDLTELTLGLDTTKFDIVVMMLTLCELSEKKGRIITPRITLLPDRRMIEQLVASQISQIDLFRKDAPETVFLQEIPNTIYWDVLNKTTSSNNLNAKRTDIDLYCTHYNRIDCMREEWEYNYFHYAPLIMDIGLNSGILGSKTTTRMFDSPRERDKIITRQGTVARSLGYREADWENGDGLHPNINLLEERFMNHIIETADHFVRRMYGAFGAVAGMGRLALLRPRSMNDHEKHYDTQIRRRFTRQGLRLAYKEHARPFPGHSSPMYDLMNSHYLVESARTHVTLGTKGDEATAEEKIKRNASLPRVARVADPTIRVQRPQRCDTLRLEMRENVAANENNREMIRQNNCDQNPKMPRANSKNRAISGLEQPNLSLPRPISSRPSLSQMRNNQAVEETQGRGESSMGGPKVGNKRKISINDYNQRVVVKKKSNVDLSQVGNAVPSSVEPLSENRIGSAPSGSESSNLRLSSTEERSLFSATIRTALVDPELGRAAEVGGIETVYSLVDRINSQIRQIPNRDTIKRMLKKHNIVWVHKLSKYMPKHITLKYNRERTIERGLRAEAERLAATSFAENGNICSRANLRAEFRNRYEENFIVTTSSADFQRNGARARNEPNNVQKNSSRNNSETSADAAASGSSSTQTRSPLKSEMLDKKDSGVECVRLPLVQNGNKLIEPRASLTDEMVDTASSELSKVRISEKAPNVVDQSISLLDKDIASAITLTDSENVVLESLPGVLNISFTSQEEEALLQED